MSDKTYVCVMFPYPSGAGLHLGHYYNYAVTDSYCRWLRYRNEDVFQPFGYDAFGLPAENYAKSIGGDPAAVTWDNITKFRGQMAHMNTLYDEKLVTCDPSYVKWTQWVFTQLHDRGLAYKAYGEVNHCPSCETVLANEQVKDEKCDRCSTKVEKKNLHQWYFRITDYKDRLIANLDKIDYPAGTIKQQRAWLENLKDWCVSRQRKWGCPIPVEGETDTLDTFVDSSFYFLRYLEDSPDVFLKPENYRQVDLYVGGAEHACMHLIYARFIHMFLHDIGVVPVEEPFRKVIHQGMITRDGHKMGKSKGNAINPENFDSDELRMYLMFIGHYFDGGDWSSDKIVGLRRFLGRMRKWMTATADGPPPDVDALEAKIDSFVRSFKFNKVVSTLMEFYNANKGTPLPDHASHRLLKIMRVFAPSFKLEQADA